MATWRKALVVGLAVLVGAVPTLARVDVGLQVTATAAQQAGVPLPHGDEMGNEELLQAEGEFWIAFAIVLCGAGIGAAMGAVHERWFDEDPHCIDRDDWREISYGALSGAMAAILSLK